MSRAFLIVLDSVGIGGAPDAARFGDEGANTLGHIAARIPLQLPHLASLGLGLAAGKASGHNPLPAAVLRGSWGFADEVSIGKDTITGHWEIAGVPVPFSWHYFPEEVPAFPEGLLKAAAKRAGVPGFLALRHASGIAVIDDHGAEHMRSGKPIMYTSADSVIQIAAHEETFGLERLYDVCRAVRELTHDMRVGRIIARPFIGGPAQGFARTGNRRDFAIAPPAPTLLDRLSDERRPVVSIGKIGDIFAHRSTGREIKPNGNEAMFDATVAAIRGLPDGGLVFVNFVDFDTIHGHRRDWQGYGQALEAFDRRLPEVFDATRDGDLLVLTADHGNDPTWTGTDHTRERVPVLCHAPGISPAFIGHRKSFADVGQTIAHHLGVKPLEAGEAWSV